VSRFYLAQFGHFVFIELASFKPFGSFIVCLQFGKPPHAAKRLPVAFAFLILMEAYLHEGQVIKSEFSKTGIFRSSFP
jgi:hypothetical protein